MDSWKVISFYFWHPSKVQISYWKSSGRGNQHPWLNPRYGRWCTALRDRSWCEQDLLQDFLSWVSSCLFSTDLTLSHLFPLDYSFFPTDLYTLIASGPSHGLGSTETLYFSVVILIISSFAWSIEVTIIEVAYLKSLPEWLLGSLLDVQLSGMYWIGRVVAVGTGETPQFLHWNLFLPAYCVHSC